MRRDAPSLWAALTVSDRRRIVHHLRVFWDVHRFRIAPQVEAVLDRRSRVGALEIVAASIRGAAAAPGWAARRLLRAARSARTEDLVADHVVVCTGPGAWTDPGVAALSRGARKRWLDRIRSAPSRHPCRPRKPRRWTT